MIVYIPGRGGSKRIPKKNIKLLGGKPVIAHVIETAKSLDFVDAVFVSTDDTSIQKIATEWGAKTKDLRDEKLSEDHVDFISLIRGDVQRFVDDDEDLLFILPTAVLVEKKHYTEAYQIYRKSAPQLLMSTIDYPISPLWAMQKDSKGFWKALHPEAIKMRSQDLPQTCVDAGLFYMMKWKEVRKFDSFIVDKLLTYSIPREVAVDVDTPSDWKVLEELYTKKSK